MVLGFAGRMRAAACTAVAVMTVALVSISNLGCASKHPVATHAVDLPPTGNTVVLVWRDGWTTLTIRASGAAHYAFEPTGWGAHGRKARQKDGELSHRALAALWRTLAVHHVCALHPSGRSPVPEEGWAELTVSRPGMRCTVRMLENDWSGPGDAGACGLALQNVTNGIAQ